MIQLILVPLLLAADPAPLTPQEKKSIETKLDRQIADLSDLIKTRSTPNLLVRRGEALFLRGRFQDSVADFDAALKDQPDLEPSLWQRGLALYYAGKPDAAARQFEQCHRLDSVDRENGIWRYLSQVKSHGVAKARRELLRYESEDRPPFVLIYRMFAGALAPEELLAEVDRQTLAKPDRAAQQFYAELYVGMHYLTLNNSRAAMDHLKRAVNNPWGRRVDGGPGFMWRLASLQLDLLGHQ